MKKGHKAATRQHILEIISQCFRRDGVSAAGIAGIMSEAGLTKGAFAPHFESKGELVREALASELAEWQHRLDEDQRSGLDLEGTIRSYLNRAHLKNLPELGKPFLANTSSRGIQESFGIMVNCLYDDDSIEANHEAFVRDGIA